MRLHHVQVSCPPGGEAKFLVDDIGAFAEACVRAGLPVRWDAGPPGYQRFHTEDGHGNRVELLADG